MSPRPVWWQLKEKKHFRQWAKQNLRRFKENEDFGSLSLKGKGKAGGTARNEYWVTADTVRKICMMSRTDQGQRFRRHFIECEQQVFDRGLVRDIAEMPTVMTSDFLQTVADRFRTMEEERDKAARSHLSLSKQSQLKTRLPRNTYE